ncbi:MAG: peptidase S41 [Bacteroidaceae bacterium]|nr:peptidase S41 [Bacteroidaceae bacterium]
MKGKYSIVILALVALVAGFSSCGEDRWAAYYPQTSHALWIDSIMRENYLWNDELADEDDLTSSYFLDAVSFLNKVKYTDDKVSYIDTACSVPVVDYGYELMMSQVNDTAYMAVITYLEPNSVAALAGLQRGEWIMGVDGAFITSSTQELLADGEAHQLTVGKYATITAPGENDDEEVEQEVIVYDREVSLPAASGYQHEDLPVVSVIDDHIGYMLYNDIAAENQSKVASASQTYAQAAITDLVLDLRYATTGDLGGMQYLASVLAPASTLGTTLAQVQYAESRHLENTLSLLGADQLENGMNLDLNNLYVITTSSTTGMAEILINCLKGVMNVVIVGQQTKGATAVACETYRDPSHDQQLRLAVCQVSDINGSTDYLGTGFTPDYEVNPFSSVGAILPFGNPEEAMLATALAAMNQ